jgi:four helix bundle protein
MVSYKFQRLKVYHLALEYVDRVYALSRNLPASERFNLCSQLERAATSIVLNIAEGSTGQSDAEQNRFLGLALRSLLETIACLDIIERQGYSANDALIEIRELGHELFIKLQAFRKSLADGRKTEDGRQSPSVPGLQSPVNLPSPGPRSSVPSLHPKVNHD